MKFVRPEKLNLLTNKELNETWVQKVIADDPNLRLKLTKEKFSFSHMTKNNIICIFDKNVQTD